MEGIEQGHPQLQVLRRGLSTASCGFLLEDGHQLIRAVSTRARGSTRAGLLRLADLSRSRMQACVLSHAHDTAFTDLHGSYERSFWLSPSTDVTRQTQLDKLPHGAPCVPAIVKPARLWISDELKC